MLQLQSPYPQIHQTGTLSYGGSQMWSENEMVKKCGCGIVAAQDLLLYLQRKHGMLPNAPSPLSLKAYNEEVLHLNHRYFPLLPHLGLNGLMLTVGINRLFREKALPYQARWAFSGAKLWNRIREMLTNDIPVILSVGPNFPGIWENNCLDFYVKSRSGTYLRSTATKAHYVTATGIDEEWLRIPSWGREYFINRAAYMDYVRRHSTYLFSNILYIRPKA